jgi:glucose-1-phosphate thymidylyltransferase
MFRAVITTCRSAADGMSPLAPVANKPVLAYGLEVLREAGAGAVMVLVDAEHARAVGDLVGDGSRWGLAAGVVTGRGPGPSTAEPLVVLSGHGLLLDGLGDALAAVEHGGVEALRLIVAGAPLAAVVGARAAMRLGPAADPARLLEGAGIRADARAVAGAWADSAEELLEANRLVLDRLEGEPWDGTAEIQGRVQVHPTADVEGSVVRGPVIIGAGARIRDSFIGPYTAIGDGAVLEGADVEHCVVFGRATIDHPGRRIESSVIGAGARVFRSFALPDALRLRVGSGAEICLS